MHKKIKKLTWKQMFSVFFAALILMSALWMTTGFVRAYWVLKTVHVFPKSALSVGWEGGANALRQDLSPKASFGSFASDNSAYIILSANAEAPPKQSEPVVVPPVEEVGPIFPPMMANPEAPPTLEQIADLDLSGIDVLFGATSSATTSSVVASTTQDIATTSEEVAPMAPDESPAPDAPEVNMSLPFPTFVTPQATSTGGTATSSSATSTSATTTKATSTQSNAKNDFLGAEVIAAIANASGFFPTVYATTTESPSDPFIDLSGSMQGTPSVPISQVTSANEDAPVCRVLGIPCHTIEFSEFDISGELRDKVLKGAVLNFSFASKAPETSKTDDKIVVRYFVNGGWRQGGDIFLNKELSNAANGGYFSTRLEDVDAWSDLTGLRVVIEYVRGSSSPIEVYLDSAWLDTEYKDRAQHVLSGNMLDESGELPENAAFSLNDGGVDQRTLLLQDGNSIPFFYTDDLDDKLFIRADKVSYKATATSTRGSELRTYVYASITNTSGVEDTFFWHAAFADKESLLVGVDQYMRNIATTTQRAIRTDVAYSCTQGWKKVTGDRHHCEETGESHVCMVLGDSNKTCLEADVTVGVDEQIEYSSGWVPNGVSDDRQGVASKDLKEKYVFNGRSDKEVRILPGQTLYFRFELATKNAAKQQFFLVAGGKNLSGDLDSSSLKSEDVLLAAQEKPKVERKRVNQRISDRTNFEAGELPSFKFQFRTQRTVVARMANWVLGRDNSFKLEKTRLYDSGGVERDMPVEVKIGAGGDWTLEFGKQPRAFRPGKYSMDLVIREGSQTYTDSVEFYWGILALNLDKSVYKPGESVQLMMGVLDERGDTVCDADLVLTVTSPNGVSAEVPVEQSGVCGFNNVVEVADYATHYSVSVPGMYTVELAEYNADGIIAHQLGDTIRVEESSPFVIKRSGATRIYPVADYAMTIELTATSDFKGEFIESVPTDFELVKVDGAEVRMYGSAKNLAWPVNLKAGETAVFTYVYDAPDISPYLYVLGPAEVRASTGGSPFSEGRQWKLASDATGNMLLYWDRTYIPTGWTCVSCLPSDPFYQRFVVGSSTAGLNGGAATHTHTATGAMNNSPGSTTVGVLNQATPVVAHTHTLTAAVAAASNLPAYRHLAIIQYNSTGEPPTIPAGAIAIFDVASSSLPSGWFRYSAQDGNYIRSESTSTVGTVGGSNTHTHTITGTVGPAATTLNAQNPGAAVAVAAAAHTHTMSTTTASINSEPLYREALLARVNATSTPADAMIAMWSADPATGWYTVSSSSEAFENRFVKASTTYGAIGGRSTSTHADINGTITGGPSATVNRNNVAGAAVASAAHTHLANVTGFSTDASLPPYRTAVFGKRAIGGAPPIVSLYDVPFDNEKTGTSTPIFEFTASDPDGTDSLVYQIQWDDDADLETSPLGDRSSDVETGCSPNCFQNLTTPVDTNPFTELERIRFTIQSPLVSGTTYFWRIRAKTNGSNIWGSWATTTSFTYVANIDPSQWFQTKDAQFDSNTLSGVQTYGADSARLYIAPPTEALVAYGEGIVQTPRYRIWNGTAWGSELSAQSVGGTVNWVVTKPATTRDEYILGVLDATSDINVQVYNGTTDTWGNLQEVTTAASNALRRGFDVAYETTSGDAIVAYCDGDADPSYYVWNGSTWTSGGTINLGSINNCEFITLASDPTSDEIILVARDTGTQYETQVWSGSAWGNSRVIGSMTQTDHEGIAVEYEESGNQAVVAVSNGNTNGFIWTSWDGTQWSVNSAQALGDDFEWGRLRADDGSDSLTLCYMDNDNDIGYLTWDGNGWAAFVAGTNERDTGGNSLDGRSVDCAYETTAGRDGYIMLPYTDTTNARYQVFNGSTWTVEADISTIQDSWTVSTIRTGDGVILSFFHDDATVRYDFSSWNGSSWTGIQTLETSPSVTVTPFLQPFDLTARVYQPGSGTMTTKVIDFDNVPNRPAWGDVIWKTTEPLGTDVTLQVLYETGGSCSTLIPDGTLPGNSAGFDIAASPLNISGLSTSTYNRICLRTTFSSSNQNLPTLDEWTLTWERQPYLTQTHFRWYTNAASSLTPTDLWPSGGNDVAEDTTIPTAYSPVPNDVMRLRLGVLAENVALSANDLLLNLQYAEGATCSAALAWKDVGAIGSTTAAWRGYNNASLSDGATLPSTLLTTADSAESYEEENYSSVNPNAISVNNEGEWDWVIQHNATAGTSYCFRVLTSGGEVLNEYDLYPSLITNSAPEAPSQEYPFDNEALASTTPWFQFVAEDIESDDVTYQIQIDDDYAFGSVNIDRDSQVNVDDFTNIVTPTDKDPFTVAQSVRFIPTTALSNGTTYYWRVRAKDRNRSNTWSTWSSIQSVSIDTSVTITTWRETTYFQFLNDTHEDTEATSTPTHEVVLTPPLTAGTTTGPLIDFDWKSSGNSWGSLSWNDNESVGDIKYHVEYYDGATWAYIPDADLPGNNAGYDTSPISLLGVSPTIYNQIRLQAVHTNAGGSPRLLDWTVTWGLSVEQPTQRALFDNEKTPTTTPTFRFYSTDPQSDDLVYELSISTTPTFTSSTTRSSDLHSGFTNTASSTDLSPFVSGNLISFKVQAADVLTNGQTYWWRVRARDPGGGNSWSVWSDKRSFTVDTSVLVSTWFQTTTEQFDTDELNSTETNAGSARITSIIREAFMAYSEGTVQTPRFRLWNGTTWGSELSGVSVLDTIRFVEAAAAPTRDEYIIATQGATGGIDAQVVDGSTDTAGNKARMLPTAADLTQRGFDVAYETLSGDALVVSCNGTTEALYRVWNGSTWGATTTITLAVTANCEWIKLAADPISDEIILVVRDATTGATDYEALVWNGSAWGNSMTMGSQVTVNGEGIAVEYEESGGQAIVAVSNGANNNFIWNSWNGSAWAGTNTVTIGNDFAAGRIVRDLGSDRMAMCYIDIDTNLGYAEWTGSAWNASAEFETVGNSVNARPISCEFETSTGRDGYIMIPYSDTTQAEYVYYDGVTLQPAVIINTITDSSEVRTARTGDGKILAFFYDDANTEYDFVYWNGSAWSAEQVIDTTSIATVNPATIPLDIVARRYPAFVAGTVESTAITFTDGTGPKWGAITFSKTTPGASTVKLYLEYFTSTSTWALVPDTAFPGNSSGTTTSPVDISNVNRITYGVIRMRADLACVAGNCPTLDDWTLNWSEGIVISGTAQAYDQTTNLTSGTVAVAVNGELQAGRTGTISGGTWSITNVTAFTDDIITVFIDGAAETAEAVGVTKYDGTGNISGMVLYERHLTLGSTDNQTITNANLSQYDNSISSVGGEEDVFHEVDAGNDLVACAQTGCGDVELWIKAGTTYRPDSASGGNVTTNDIEINGTLTADGNIFRIAGSWDSNAIFNKDTSTIIFTATSTVETIDFTGASSTAFTNLTMGETSGTARWNLLSPIDVTGTLNITYGSLSQNVTRSITIGGDLTIGASGLFDKGGLASTTFNGAGSRVWTDNTATKQDMGEVRIDGTSKTITLGSNVRVTDLVIGSDDILNASGSNYAIDVYGHWTNNNVFTAQAGTVTFRATTTGRTIAAGTSSFYNMTFNGVGGNWSFTAPTLTAGNNLTVATGTVTMPTATTSIAGNFDASTGAFSHNNGTVLFNSTAAGRTVHPGASSFYDLVFNGSGGAWSFGSTNATSSRSVVISAGTLTAPSATFAIGGSFVKNAGTFTHNSGTLKFTAASASTVRLTNSDTANLWFSGGGTWSLVDASATSTGNVLISSGTVVAPSTMFTIGGSYDASTGAFIHSSGTVKFNASATGRTISAGLSSFYNLIFNGVNGGWTIASNATSTNSLSITNANTFIVSPGVTLAVGGTFTNSVGGSATTFTDSILSLFSGTSYTINTKTVGSDTYGNLTVSSTTRVRMWNSAASTTVVSTRASLYSMNHSNVSGDLYIWGTYTTTGNEYWNYANDFDGTVLSGGSRRQVDVRFAPNASFVSATGTLSVVGDTTATTTIANQGSGSYSFMHSGGSLNALYYQVRNTDASGIVLTGSTTITSLANGDYEMTVPTGGSMMTVGQSVLNVNPALQILNVRFATSSGVLTGFNVTATGTPSTYWWFRDHYGNFAGEANDSDPSGNPGNIRWDDSAYTITVEGTVYSDEGVTPMDVSVCNGSSPYVTIVVNGTASYTGFCDSGTGDFTIPGVTFVGDAVLTAYLNTNGGRRAVTVTRTPTANITNLDLYENILIARHEGVNALTINNIAVLDNSEDSDIFFTAATSSTHTLTTNPGTELYVWGGKTFAPGGDVTLLGGTGSARDGKLHVAANGTFSAAGSQSHVVGGHFTLESGALFSAASSTVTFTATTTRTISASSTIIFWNATFNGTNGAWSILSTPTTTIQNALAITAGTLAGIGNVVVESGGISGSGSVSMTGGTFALRRTGTFGNALPWQFYNLTVGDSANSGTMTKSGAGTTTVTRTLAVATSETLQAGSSPWVLSGGGTPFVIAGTFSAQTAPFWYTATSSTLVRNTTYADLYFAPALSGTPTYTLAGGSLLATNITVGGTQPVTVTADTNDPSISASGNVAIVAGSTLIASNVGAFDVGGSWTNAGTFTPSGGSVQFNASGTGRTINAGASSFYDVVFNSAIGGWTIASNATSSRNTTITNAAEFTVSPGVTLAVGGAFTNSVGGGSTVFTNSYLSLFSGTSYAINTKTTGADFYGTLNVSTTTQVSMWNSSAATTSVSTTSSLYSQDHAAVDGSLYIYGAYHRSTGSDYWSYDTDFDGTSLGAPRQVNVRIASSSSVTLSGGILDILGAATATTTIQVQGSGRYDFNISGGTINAQYYAFRDLSPVGLNISGTPTITSLSNGDFELVASGGSLITVAGTAIDANPLKIMQTNRFGTSTGVVSGTNVTATGSSISSWKFNLHYGDIDGEGFDSDPAGDPGYIRWDDSATQVTISGRVYSDEGTSVSSVCDGSTYVVHLKVQGAGTASSTCAVSDGLFTISNVQYNPGDVLTLYLNTNGGVRAANISVDPVTNISNMELYENRVIVRHEDSSPITIAKMALYDVDLDSDIPFNATDAASDTLVLPPNTKLIVWNGKTFAPAGNITLQSGGLANAWDGTLELYASAILSAAGTQSHSIGGSFLMGANALFQSASSTVTFTATTTGKTISTQGSSFNNISFTGVGGNWAFASSTVTALDNFTIATGTVTLATGTTTVGGSFSNTGGTFMHNNGVLQLNANASGKTIEARGSSFYSITFNGTGGAWSFVDTNATSTSNFNILAGTVTMPSATMVVGGWFDNSGGTFTHNSGTVKLIAGTDKYIRASGSSFYSLLFNGVGGAWTFLDVSATTTNNFTVTNGSTTLPAGILSIGGSFIHSGTFTHNNGTVKFTATATGRLITATTSPFYNIAFTSSSGGWTITESATSTNNTSITSANSFTLSPNKILAVGGAFTNSVGGTATVWATSTLSLYSGGSYAINTKTAGGDTYGTLQVSSSTKLSMWNSSAATTSVESTSSLYSQDHAAVDGSLYIYGAYSRTTGADYWSRATDFDGTALGSPRTVNVRIASSSSITYSGSSLEIIGAAGATTTIQNQGTGRYAISLSGGTLSATYFQFRNIDASGFSIAGTPTISAFAYGDFELDVPAGGTMMTVSGDAIDANASMVITGMRFATSSGVNTGYNVTRTGTPITAWTFSLHEGNYDGEAFDNDGGDGCGNIRWSDSSCLFVSQEHFRWRNDDGGEGAPASEWYDVSWTKRKKIAITNNTATAYTNIPVKIVVNYDADMQSDFDDLRFTTSSGTTSTNYWVENIVASASTTVWVKVPSLPASGSATIYMYYGNGSAASASDGTNTFTFFDDFEDDNITEYSGETGKFDTHTTFNYTGSYGLEAFDPADQTNGGIRRTGSLTSQGSTIRFFQYIDASAPPTGGADDEPCTLFGVQGSGQNYAVCLDGYPNDQISIAENVTRNDASGTIHASTSVSYSTGWYEVEADWLTGGTINVTVYDSTGAVFATSTATDTSYSSGGMGFAYWGMHGGWDFYSVRPYTAIDPTYVFGTEQVSNGATWRGAEDTAISDAEEGQNLRLRFSVQNTGAPLTNQTYMLEYAAKGVALNCESVAYGNYAEVPPSSSCGSAPMCMSPSTQFADHEATSPLMSYPSSMNFASGQMLEDTSNITSSMSLSSNTATEVEYNFELTNNATQSEYCFRVTDDSTDLDNYTRIAHLVLSHAPQISDISLNNALNINLTENATTTIYATSTVSDQNGFADLLSATSTIYRSSVGPACVANDNNCYQLSTSSCSFSNCSGNSCTLSCVAPIQYFADPTDTDPSQNWLARIQVRDTTNKADVDTSFAVELNTLYALNVTTGAINFNSIYVGQNSGSTVATSTVQNTGNTGIDIRVSGTHLTDGSNLIDVGKLKYATTTFEYGSCSICQFLTGSPVDVDVNIPKSTATTTQSTSTVYWGIDIPTGTRATLHTGVNTFIAVTQ
jgi:Domain of unknown function (DUF2341)